jgi:hypothetical protein
MSMQKIKQLPEDLKSTIEADIQATYTIVQD